MMTEIFEQYKYRFLVKTVVTPEAPPIPDASYRGRILDAVVGTPGATQERPSSGQTSVTPSHTPWPSPSPPVFCPSNGIFRARSRCLIDRDRNSLPTFSLSSSFLVLTLLLLLSGQCPNRAPGVFPVGTTGSTRFALGRQWRTIGSALQVISPGPVTTVSGPHHHHPHHHLHPHLHPHHSYHHLPAFSCNLSRLRIPLLHVQYAIFPVCYVSQR